VCGVLLVCVDYSEYGLVNMNVGLCECGVSTMRSSVD
jgi:hypothetical protein